MRFEVSYNSGMTHEVNLAGSLVVLGRDPGCDIVLNDTKCSRRHAFVEDTPEGLVIVDSGSANGVYVNERRVDRAFVRPGDTIRLGDVRLRLLVEIGATVVVALDDVQLPPVAPPQESLTQPPVSAPLPAPSELAAPANAREPVRQAWPGTADSPPPARPAARPLTVTVLSGIWALGGPGASAAIVFTTWRLGVGPFEWALAALLCLLLVSGGLAMALGLRRLAPWARHLQIAGSYLGLLACPFTPAAATSLLYMSRSDVRRTFEAGARDGAGPAETTFAVSLVFMVLAGAVGAGIVAFLVWPVRPTPY